MSSGASSRSRSRSRSLLRRAVSSSSSQEVDPRLEIAIPGGPLLRGGVITGTAVAPRADLEGLSSLKPGEGEDGAGTISADGGRKEEESGISGVSRLLVLLPFDDEKGRGNSKDGEEETASKKKV